MISGIFNLNGSTNLDATFYFAFGTIAMLFVAWRFIASKQTPLKQFGHGLLAYGLAFATWTYIVATHPANLDLVSTIGVIPFVAGHLLMVNAATHDWQSKNRQLAFGFGGAFLVVLFVLRTWVMPSAPGFSDQGLFYFHADPIVLLMYIVTFAGAFMTALQVVSNRIATRWLAAMTRIGFNMVVLSGAILLAASDENLQYYNGWVMLIGLLMLVVSYLRAKPTVK